jgi:hypothetical protein
MQDKLIDSDIAFDENTDGLVIQRFQEIPHSFIDKLKEERFQNTQGRVKNEMHRAASIPVAVVEKWQREGYDVFKEPIKKTLAKLKNENLDAFITSDKV